MNQVKTNYGKLLLLAKSHPKKSTLLAIILLLYVMYKKRKIILHFTFNQIITRMNDKFMKRMSEQVSNVEKYNKKLTELQQLTEEFYSQRKYKITLHQLFRTQEIEILRENLKKLDKNSLTYQTDRTQSFIQLTQELLIYGVSVMQFSRLFELLLFIAQLLYQREKEQLFGLMDQDVIVVQNVFIYDIQIIYHVQYEYCKLLYLQVRDRVAKTVLPNYGIVINFHSFQQLVNQFDFEADIQDNGGVSVVQNLRAINELAQTHIDQTFDSLVNKINQEDLLGKPEILEGVQKGKLICQNLIKELIDLNTNINIKTFWLYSMRFSFMKIWNRFLILDQKQSQQKKDLALFTQLTNFHKICVEEFLSESSELNNEQFYHKKIKQAFQYVNQGDENLSQLDQFLIAKNAIVESTENKQLNQTIRQFSRKIYFVNEAFKGEDIFDENGGGNPNEFAEMLMKLTQR